MYLSAAKYWGWKVPLALDSRELEQRCRKTLQVWGLRLMSMEMAKQVEDKQIVGGGDTLRLMDAIASAADQAARYRPSPWLVGNPSPPLHPLPVFLPRSHIPPPGPSLCSLSRLPVPLCGCLSILDAKSRGHPVASTSCHEF